MRAELARAAFFAANVALFDFDGVLVDSNCLKTEAFLELAESLDPEILHPIRKFLRKNPSATRFAVIDKILSLTERHDLSLRMRLLEDYSLKSKSKLKALNIDNSLHALRQQDNRDWGLVSATEQSDLMELSDYHNVSRYFSVGIFGSPKTKEANILAAAASKGVPTAEIIYLGDRVSDLEAARATGTEFIFVRDWSDARGEDVAELGSQLTIGRLSDLVT